MGSAAPAPMRDQAPDADDSMTRRDVATNISAGATKPPAPEPRAAQGRPGQPPTNGWTCPLDHPIKGDFRTYSGDRCIYYPPGTPTYVESRTDRCYATEDEARQDGCRRSRR